MGFVAWAVQPRDHALFTFTLPDLHQLAVLLVLLSMHTLTRIFSRSLKMAAFQMLLSHACHQDR